MSENSNSNTYIFVDEYIGGLGNQLFQYCNLIYLSKIYNKIPIILDQEISYGYVNSKVYKNIFNLIQKSRTEINNYPISYINYEQFEKKNYDFGNDLAIYNENHISLKGLNMNISNFKNILPQLRNIFNINTEIKDTYCLISFRSFNEDNRPDWRISFEYYIKAINYAKENINNVIFIAFTDDYDYAYEILKNNNIENNYIIYNGKRDGTTDVEHFYKMMECNHAILCNSSFAIWSMIMNNNDNKHKVIIPSNTFLDQLGIDDVIGSVIRL